MASESVRTSLVLDGPPPTRVISATRRFVQEVYENLLDDPEMGSRVALAAHELLENLAKYARGGSLQLLVELVQRDGQSHVRIKTKNLADAEEIRELKQVLDELGEAQYPFKTYVDFIARSAESDVGSGLGLARVRAEADMNIRYAVSGDEVTVFAETAIPVRREP